MKASILLLCVAAALCALPTSAQTIPAGDDLWATAGGGQTTVVLGPADWKSLCGVTVTSNFTVNFKGQPLPNSGNGDTVVTRLDAASLPAVGTSATVRVQLKSLSLVSENTHPCSPYVLTATPTGTQTIDKMTITRTGANGGTFVANIPVKAVVRAMNGSTVVGSTIVSGVLGDATTSSPWSYQQPAGGTPFVGPWYPSVDPVTLQPTTSCRRGNKSLPAFHCYNPPSCPKVGTPLKATPGAVANPCLLSQL